MSEPCSRYPDHDKLPACPCTEETSEAHDSLGTPVHEGDTVVVPFSSGNPTPFRASLKLGIVVAMRKATEPHTFNEELQQWECRWWVNVALAERQVTRLASQLLVTHSPTVYPAYHQREEWLKAFQRYEKLRNGGHGLEL